MKKLTLVLSSMLLSILVFAQVPEGFNYQAILRNAAGQEITNTIVGIQISLLQTSTEGTVVYVEQFTQETNNFGLINLMIGTGDVQTGTFSSIIWGDGPYFLKVELDETGGTGYIEIGTSQLLSVPYALHANTVDNSDDADPDPINEIQGLSDVLSEGSDAGNNEIENVSKIGIGTLAPKAQLHLKSVADVEIFLEADTNNITETDNPIIKISQDNGLTVGGWGFDDSNEMFLTSYSTANHGFYISTDSIVRLSINNSGIIDVKNNNITNLADPVNDQDAVTKAYIDDLIASSTDDLKETVFTLIRLSDLNDLLAEGINLVVLLDAGYTFSDLQDAGVTVSEMVADGIPVSDLLVELLDAGYTVSDLQDAGVTLSEMVEGGIPVSDLLAAGFTILELFDANVGVGSLEQNGVSEQDLIDAGLIGTLTDIEGADYKWVKIGTQVWMAENLKTTKYNDGTDISNITDDTEWINLSTGAYCWYYNLQASYGNTYGALYNGYAVETDKLCPSGWHVATDEEWTTLIDFLGGEDIAGGKLKETGTTHWGSTNTGVTNETGFTALPGGYRDNYYGSFYSARSYGGWWSPAGYVSNYDRNRYIYSYAIDVNRGYTDRKKGYSVRCLRDD